jgi:T5orf172 domain
MKEEAKVFRTIKNVKGYTPTANGFEFIDLTNADKYKGIYSIGLDDPVRGEQTIVKSKIGLGGLTTNTGGLFKRLTSYYIAYPDGFWMYALLITKDNKIVRDLEKAVHSRLNDKRYKSDYLTNLRVSEWFRAKIKEIRKVFQEVAEEFKTKGVKVIYPSEFEE